jgi:acyl carrier protein
MPTPIDIDRVRTIVASVLEVDPAQIAGSTHFMNDLGADSLRVIEIVARLESELQVFVDQSELARLVSLDAIREVAGTSVAGA